MFSFNLNAPTRQKPKPKRFSKRTILKIYPSSFQNFNTQAKQSKNFDQSFTQHGNTAFQKQSNG